ncbi:MAG: PIN domain-containing protein [Bradymonadaceae bacterium]|nr:PIN domain-containing protein [Lujinxingiaceae bacterium]
MAFIVVYDANVLFAAPLRDLLIRVAQAGVVRARWTSEILDECFRSVLAQRPDLNEERLNRTRELMNRAIRDVLVTGYEPLVQGLLLPDPDDRHVLAAAVRAGAQTIVTFNLKDFPSSQLGPLGIEAKHPDDFILEAIHLAPGAVSAAITEQARALSNPPQSLDHLLDTLSALGLSQSVSKLRELFGMDV